MVIHLRVLEGLRFPMVHHHLAPMAHRRRVHRGAVQAEISHVQTQEEEEEVEIAEQATRLMQQVAVLHQGHGAILMAALGSPFYLI